MEKEDIYEEHLERGQANYTPLSPLSFLRRTALVYPDRLAIVHGSLRRTWGEVYERCMALASALRKRGVGRGRTLSALCANTPQMYELHFAVAMAGGVLNAINIRLDAATIAFFLEHGQADLFMVDQGFLDLGRDAMDRIQGASPRMIVVHDEEFLPSISHPEQDYEALLHEGDPQEPWSLPEDEWQAITLNYTSGTTGDSKGVVYHHRGAYLSAISNALVWELKAHPVYLWTLPMFHCNGWCFPWTLAALGGTSVCLRGVEPADICAAIQQHGVTHFCAAPIVLNRIVNAAPEIRRGLPRGVQVMTAGAAPPEAVIAGMEDMGFVITHVYGLTETYGPVTLCARQDHWNTLSAARLASIKARQGVRDHMLEDMMVADPTTMAPVPRDGQTLGEVFMRGNKVMKGYLKNAPGTRKALAHGWFHSGDLAVVHPDGYIQIRDRSKDIIVSGGENISSIEIEDVLYKHPGILEAAVVARPHTTWGESPCAFVTLVEGSEETEQSIIAYCRDHMAHFKVPRNVIFTDLPKTSTGKIKKYQLRSRAAELGERD